MRWTTEQYEEFLAKNKKEQKRAKKSKYNAQHTKVDGILFDSKKEADYYIGLKMLVRAGEIKGFARQAEFIVIEGDDETAPTKYKADFVVFRNDDTAEIVDTKGVETEVFKIKMKAFHEKMPRLEVKKA